MGAAPGVGTAAPVAPALALAPSSSVTASPGGAQAEADSGWPSSWFVFAVCSLLALAIWQGLGDPMPAAVSKDGSSLAFALSSVVEDGAGSSAALEARECGNA